MSHKRTWTQSIAQWRSIAEEAQSLTDDGWTVHTIIPADNVNGDDGAILVAYKDTPDFSDGVSQ